MSSVLLGMGNPLLDISADVPQEFLDKYGLKLNNAILCEGADAEKLLPLYEDMVKQFPVKYIAGGATQNSIRVAQWMLQEPGATAYFGAIGKGDKFGQQLKDSATADGVAVHYYETEEAATGTCAVLVNNKERSLVANLAAANCYKIDHFNSPEIKAVWEKAKFIYSAGFFLTVSPPSIMAAAQHAAANNHTYCMNLSAPFLCQFFKDPMMAAMPYVDILFANESEAEAFGEAHGFEDKSPKAVALKIAAMDKVNKNRTRMVIFTQGSQPTICVQDGVATEHAVTAMKDEDIVDTNGAGDAFVGGFLAALVKGKAVADAIQAGHYSASVILKVSGTELTGTPELKL